MDLDKKKLLVIPHYFYPDVASTGQLVTELCEELQKEFSITVICPVPSYTGVIDKKYKNKRFYFEKYMDVNVIRVRVPEFIKGKKISRICNIIIYFINAIGAIVKSGKQDVILTISQPPILGGVLGVIAKKIKKAKFIYNIQDFNPEQIEVVGYFKNKIIIGIARAIDKYSCRKADMIVVVGRDMKETLCKRFKKKIPNNVVINNWADDAKIYPLERENEKVIEFKKRYGLMDKFVIMYSGNLGLYYDLENIIKVIGQFKDKDDMIFAFIGEGAVKEKLMEYCTSNSISNIKFIPYQKKENLIYSLNAGDVHLVSNMKGIKGISVPSKIYSIIAANKMVLGILENDTEARSLIEKYHCGICCNPGNYDDIKKSINYMYYVYKVVMNNSKNNRINDVIKRDISKKKSISLYKEVIRTI
ncbi:glycosyltransferase family 4 protein [Clostridium pasteurianum]|uniref:glycosyltransferase family 4 protein n=1 Tax=Clostridium pasteurianum TaxID=1501 RepID=UPI0022608772|nr:glycosyltransferase family 4 protein [Clostridium pasteurianum]UZW14940.1 glycosyltransferase family 4 protein [Clostridium pasteurianum]